MQGKTTLFILKVHFFLDFSNKKKRTFPACTVINCKKREWRGNVLILSIHCQAQQSASVHGTRSPRVVPSQDKDPHELSDMRQQHKSQRRFKHHSLTSCLGRLAHSRYRSEQARLIFIHVNYSTVHPLISLMPFFFILFSKEHIINVPTLARVQRPHSHAPGQPAFSSYAERKKILASPQDNDESSFILSAISFLHFGYVYVHNNPSSYLDENERRSLVA